jgi:hypothetical protein
MHSRFIENHPICILEDRPLISKLILSQYLDMTSGGVFVHCTVEEGKLILDRILSACHTPKFQNLKCD